MKILVTGATGFVGTVLVNLLKQQGHQLVLVGHHLKAESKEKIHAVNLAHHVDWQPLLQGCDAIVHLAARVHEMKESAKDAAEQYMKVNVEATRNLAEQAAITGVKRFIYLSSLKVNGENSRVGLPFNESDQPNPEGPYAQSKYLAEQALNDLAKKTAIEVTIVRPPLVYGPNVRANFETLLSIIHRKLPLPFASIVNQRSYVYVGNLAHFIVTCLTHTKAANQCFLISDAYDLSTPQLIKQCAIALGVQANLFFFPQRLLYILSTLFGKKTIYQRLCGDLTVDVTKAKELLCWSPPFSVEDGLQETAKAFRHRK